MSLYHDTTSAIQSYLATGLGFMSDVNWMAVYIGKRNRGSTHVR